LRYAADREIFQGGGSNAGNPAGARLIPNADRILRAVILWLAFAMLGLGCISPASAGNFKFDRDTLAFANSTVFDYHEGKARLRRSTGPDKEKTPRYTRRCFVMCRTTVQFQKFARFEPKASPLTDEDLAKRIRQLTKHAPWQDPLPPEQRVVFPGYRNLRELSHKRGWVLQKNIGLGWPTYVRIGNYRMVYKHGKDYQAYQHDEIEKALARGELFVAFLSDFPTLHINHAVMVYGKKRSSPNERVVRYNTYDPNHPDGPRELTWFPDKRVFEFEKDEEFVGGFARVFRVYGTPLQ
jgi:hypothetical protein